MQVSGVIITGPRKTTVHQVRLRDPTPAEVVVRVTACGLCTWEQRVYRGAKPTYPFWGGHEVCGFVEDVGRDVGCNVAPGDFVALALMYRCGKCRCCRTELDNHCAYLHPKEPDGLPGGPRGLSTQIIVTGSQLVPIDSALREKGALIEPLACTIRSVRRSQIKRGQTAVVIGAGTMGLLHVAALLRMGVDVLVCEPDGSADRTAGKLGIRHLSGDVRGIVSAVGQQGWADAVFCVRGGSKWISAAVEMCARGGVVVLFQSIPTAGIGTLDMNDLHQREISVVGSVSQRLEDFAQAAELTKLYPNFFDALTTTTTRYSDPVVAFEKALDPAVNRVLVTFNA